MKRIDGSGEMIMTLYTCDGCGREERGLKMGQNWLRPAGWYSREDHDGEQVACSRECIQTIAKTTGKTAAVMLSSEFL